VGLSSRPRRAGRLSRGRLFGEKMNDKIKHGTKVSLVNFDSDYYWIRMPEDFDPVEITRDMILCCDCFSILDEETITWLIDDEAIKHVEAGGETTDAGLCCFRSQDEGIRDRLDSREATALAAEGDGVISCFAVGRTP
jgi:hypothetical protein